MYVLSCRDLGLADCDFSAAADSRRRLIDIMFVHARDEHPELIAGITDEQRSELAYFMQEQMKERAAA